MWSAIQEKEEKLDGDAALSKLFRDIYQNADEDMRRAMSKSFVRYPFFACFEIHAFYFCQLFLVFEIIKIFPHFPFFNCAFFSWSQMEQCYQLIGKKWDQRRWKAVPQKVWS